MLLDSPLEFSLGAERLPLNSFAFSQSVDSVCGSFEAKLGGPVKHKRLVEVGKSLTIRIQDFSRECIFDGFHYSFPEELTIAGRDKTSLICDSSAPMLHFPKAQTFISLARTICSPLEITVHDPENLGGFTVTDVSITPGDTGFDVLSQVAKNYGVFLSTEDGKSVLIRSNTPAGLLTIDGSSPVLEFSVQKNFSEMYGRYIGIKESADIFGSSKRIVLKDRFGNPLKQKIMILKDSESPEKALIFEAITRRRRGQTMDVILSGFRNIALNTKVNVDLKGLRLSGVVAQIDYSISPKETTTRISIGAL